MFALVIASGELTKVPKDATTYVDAPETNLTCGTSLSEPVNWEFQCRSCTNEYELIFIAGQVADSFKVRFKVTLTVVSTKENLYTLTVINATLDDAGTYKCIDKGGQGSESIAKLTVFGKYDYDVKLSAML